MELLRSAITETCISFFVVALFMAALEGLFTTMFLNIDLIKNIILVH